MALLFGRKEKYSTVKAGGEGKKKMCWDVLVLFVVMKEEEEKETKEEAVEERLRGRRAGL